MSKKPAIAKIVLGIIAAVLVSSEAPAVRRKAHSLHKRPLTYYRAIPVQRYRWVPFGYSISQGGPYHKDVLPDGTITGPIAPEANGG
jgi:hypothetical protein